MKFGPIQNIRFHTDKGAYSAVTDRENKDSQITLTDYEAELLVSYFGDENILVGRVKTNPDLASKEFRLYPGGEQIRLNVNYPKEGKAELRLYLSSGAGFKPEGGEIWFIYLHDSDLWIGALPEEAWRDEFAELKQDESDDIYQRYVNDINPIRTAELKGRDIYIRDRDIALQSMERSGYKCEYNPEHYLFTSRFSRKPFVEAHHLIPMGMQPEFKTTLDTVDNVFCLCPMCHRAVHHAEEPIAREILDQLANIRPVHDQYSLDIEELFGLYSVEEIV